ncbi:helix-turn-helix domain-containing protein [Mobilicoccus massiliensis]|uniref:helix-turn-helix domain-containing protein n=1 Tax=Mobilicoccus massiliensis TaxID=1522310 RepID=UPI000693CD9D|nr:helix-turn-helix transcriptional regulator [Mobilicoccus massiliensis]
MQQSEWPRSWTRRIGAEIARLRKEEGLSQTDLCERCAGFGFPIVRNTVVGLETGRREGITVHELVVIARALSVSPAELLFPGAKDGPQDRTDPEDGEAQIEYMPGVTMPASAAWKNFHGRSSPASVRLVQANIQVRRAAELLDGLVQEQRESDKASG